MAVINTLAYRGKKSLTVRALQSLNKQICIERADWRLQLSFQRRKKFLRRHHFFSFSTTTKKFQLFAAVRLKDSKISIMLLRIASQIVYSQSPLCWPISALQARTMLGR